MIKETLCEKAIDYEYPPDGGSTPIVDAYDGCQLRCPYCFQWADPTWNRHILVKTNVQEVLARELESWDPAETLYIGSRGDPYMPLEGKYRLTRAILQTLLERGIPTILSTKSDAPALFDDFDLFRRFGDKLTICVGQANLAHLRQPADPRSLPNIRTANALASLGIRTWVFITPTLPGITDVQGMIDALPADMPVFLDRLRLDYGSVFKRRFFAYMRAHFPALEPRYRAYLEQGNDPYYQELRTLYQDTPRVKFVFGDC